VTLPTRRPLGPATRLAWVVAALAATLLTAASTDRYTWDLPTGWPEPMVPMHNPMTPEKVALGRHLFYDKGLSADGTVACATCHQQDKAFTDGLAVSHGIHGTTGVRSAMALGNVAYLPTLTWTNPQLTSLEVQALIPLFGEQPVEMGMAGQEQVLFDKLASSTTYSTLFTKAYPELAHQGRSQLFTLTTITQALAAFQRSLLTFNSPYDRYTRDKDNAAIGQAAKRGEALFFGEKMECYHCHGGLNFTDNLLHARLPYAEHGFHNTGLYNVDGRGAYPAATPGVIEFTGLASDAGRVRTPSLRNVGVTAPYMHDGSIATLEAVIRQHYALGGRSTTQAAAGGNPLKSELIQGFDVTDGEVADLVAFLHTLTDTRFLNDPRHSDPWSQKSTNNRR
jgi:cytochrome c peroxidase